jgi:hypothetical protein
MKIIIAAQNYGFCPTSYAFTIARTLQLARIDVDISIVETASTKIFSELNKDTQIHMISSIPSKDDLIISCYEPLAIMEAWINDIPSIYYCNLLWFWLKNSEVNLPEIENDIQLFKQLKKDGREEKLRDEFNKKCQKHPISGMMYGYFLADASFCRNYLGCDKAIKHLPRPISTRLKPIGIFMPYEQTPIEQRSNLVLFQLSGSENPHTHFGQNEIYIRGCYELASQLSQKYPTLQFVFCVNPSLLNQLKEPLIEKSNLTIRGSVSQKEQFALLREVKALFVPPGLGTSYEALYSGTPFFYLPEQNIGQHPNWKLFKEMGIDILACLVNEEFPDQGYQVHESSVDNLFERIKLLFDTRMERIVELASFFFREQVPHWPEIHKTHIEKLKAAIGEKPFLTGDDIAHIFLSILPTLKPKIYGATFSLQPSSMTRMIDSHPSSSSHYGL